MKPLKADYLVIGCGASSLAFLDVMVRETGATFIVTDRRDAPGGHWNDAYPFVRLHQPSAYYGVASRRLGRDRIETSGPNEGLYELASGTEVLAYFNDVMQADLLPSGRVRFLPLSEYCDADGTVVSLMTGARQRVEIGCKLVDGRRIGTQIPLTHERGFAVAEGVACIPPNELPRRAPGHAGYVVLGAGKTAMDTVIWLLERGADADRICWVRPRDAWMINRITTQPGIRFFDETIGGQLRQLRILAAADNVATVCEGMEAEGAWLRIDPDRQPDMFHAAVISPGEMEALRRVRDVVRLGRVTEILPGGMVLEKGTVDVGPGRLFVDCTAGAAAASVHDREPVFSPGRINLQMIRPYQPTFSAALIGHIEATVEDERLRAEATRVTPMTDTPAEWIERRMTGARNQMAWGSDDELRAWLRDCRLDATAMAMRELDPGDAEKAQVLGALREILPAALQNMARLVASSQAVPSGAAVAAQSA